MIGKGIAESTPVTLAEVKRVLEKRQGTAGEFGFEQQTSLSYAQRFAHISHADAESMLKEVLELELPLSTAVKIVDILPKAKSQIMLIFAKDKAELSEKKMAELEAIIAKFSKKAKKLATAAESARRFALSTASPWKFIRTRRKTEGSQAATR